MNILAIETTGAAASAVVLRKDGRIFKSVSEDTMSHLQRLLPMVREVLAEAGIAKEELSLIAVSVGPGSFTGIRIGMATAKTLAQALGLPVAAVPTLKSFVFAEINGALQENPEPEQTENRNTICIDPIEATVLGLPTAGVYQNIKISQLDSRCVLICPMLDARRGQVYAAAFGKSVSEAGTGISQEVVQDAYAVEAFLKLAVKAAESAGIKLIKVFGDGADSYSHAVSEAAKAAGERVIITLAEKAERYQDAEYVARLAAEMAKAGELCGYNEAQPVYLKKAEAERKLLAGKLRRKKENEKQEPVYEFPPEDEKIIFKMLDKSFISELAKLDALCFSNPWNETAFAGDINGSRSFIYCGAFNSKQELIGFAGMVYILDEGEVNRVAVHPLYRSRNIAGSLMSIIIEESEKQGVCDITLEVREANRSAISLYKNQGFLVQAKRKGYYVQTGENALIMKRSSKNNS